MRGYMDREMHLLARAFFFGCICFVCMARLRLHLHIAWSLLLSAFTPRFVLESGYHSTNSCS